MKRERLASTCLSPPRGWPCTKKRCGTIERQFVPRPRHRDIEQAALLLDLVGRTGGEVRGDAAVDAR